MKLTSNSTKLMHEVNRIKTEHEMNKCTVPMLISALFAIRGDEDFTNLFNAYFEKLLKVKLQTIDKVLEREMAAQKNAERKGEKTTETKDFTFEARFDKFSQCTDKNITVIADEELARVLDSTVAFAGENKKDKIIPDYFSVALFEIDSPSMRRFIKEISVNYMEAESFFNRNKILAYEIVPYEISEFITYTNPLYEGKQCYIVGRENVLNRIYSNMLKTNKRNVVLYGFPGVGKSSVGTLLKHNISNGLCPETFKGYKVLEMSVNDFIRSSKDKNGATEKMNYLMSFLTRRKDDIILLIDEIQMIIGTGGLFENDKLDLSQTLKPILERGEVRIVGISLYEDYFSFTSDDSLNRRFFGLEVKQPKLKEVFGMIKPRIEEIAEGRKVRISDKIIDDAIWYAACFEFRRYNPDKSMDVIDGAIANAKLHNRSIVEHQDVLDVFKIAYETWDGMSPEVKRNTAYHEAGHFVINRLKNPGNFVVLAVSIYPTDDYGGVNVLEYDETVTPNTTEKYFKDEIMCDLAGRVAEKIISGEINAGASTDLENAMSTAQSMITEYGMSTGAMKNSVFPVDGMGNNESKREVELEAKQIIEDVFEECEDILMENFDFLEAIAEALLVKHIMKREELEEVWNSVEEKRKKEGIPEIARKHESIQKADRLNVSKYSELKKRKSKSRKHKNAKKRKK